MHRILLFLVILAWTTQSPAMIVLVDPGHGGNDTGAVRGSLKESQIALKIAHKLADMLRRDGRYQVYLTRETDRFLTLEQRNETSMRLKPDIFLSIHLNSFPDDRVRGKEVYFQNQLPPDEEAMFLASKENIEDTAPNRSPTASAHHGNNEIQLIVDDLRRSHRIRISGLLSFRILEAWKAGAGRTPATPRKVNGRALRQAPFRVLANNDVPAVLVEAGYLSHPEEGKLLGTDAYQTEIATSLYTGINQYKESVDKTRLQP